MKPLRLKGYEFTSPLLACDTEIEIHSTKNDELSKKIENYVKSEIEAGKITSASVYVRDYTDGSTLNVGADEKYYPASLSKIPMMIAAFKMDEGTGFLSKTYQYDDKIDHNDSIEIKPESTLENGKTYSIEEAINKLIMTSDNNAYYFLTKYIDINVFKKTFQDLKIPLRDDPASPEDYLTAKEYSYFLRVLYNSTYLSPNDSEKALKILSEVKYKNGLASGLPDNEKIAHKFGIRTKNENGATTRELHDCGIVYEGTPYLICVMTKNNSSLGDAENVIKNISSTVYNGLRK